MVVVAHAWGGVLSRLNCGFVMLAVQPSELVVGQTQKPGCLTLVVTTLVQRTPQAEQLQLAQGIPQGRAEHSVGQGRFVRRGLGRGGEASASTA